MTQSKQYIQLSVFDRLRENLPYSILGGTVGDIQIVRTAVLRDVENLLNTRRNIIKPPENYAYLNRSLYVYGLEDFVARNPKSPFVRKLLKASILSTIEKFEPRLKRIAVDFNPMEGNEQNLCFEVKATLIAEPIQEPIYFDTWFSASRGEYKIDNVK